MCERVSEGEREVQREKGEGRTDGVTRPIYEDECVCPRARMENVQEKPQEQAS